MALLIINHDESFCGDCGKSANMHQARHFDVLGWNGPTPGCGHLFTESGSEYDGLALDIVRLRQDLPYRGVFVRSYAKDGPRFLPYVKSGHRRDIEPRYYPGTTVSNPRMGLCRNCNEPAINCTGTEEG